MALYAIGGILKHAPALLRHLPARRPTATSGWCRASRRRSIWPTRSGTARRPIRIPMYSPNPKAKRLEFRCPDPSCNPYLSFSAILMAAIDGIQNKIDPGEPLDKDIYDLDPEELDERAADAGLAGRGAEGACGPTTSSCSAATCSRPT